MIGSSNFEMLVHCRGSRLVRFAARICALSVAASCLDACTASDSNTAEGKDKNAHETASPEAGKANAEAGKSESTKTETVTVESAQSEAGLLPSSAADAAFESEDSNEEVIDAGEPGPAKALLDFEAIALEGDPTFLTHFEFLPNKSEFLAISRHGDVLHYALKGDETKLLGRFKLKDTESTTDCGLIGLALDPKFEDNHAFYLSSCFDLQHSGVVRYVLDTSDYALTAKSAVEIIRVGDDSATRAIHNVGKIGFDDHGNMFTGFGEKGLPKRARATDVALGKFARFRPRAGGGYDPPKPANDFLDETDEARIAFATGLRSPWTAMQDSLGRFWIGDVGDNGDNSREKINLATSSGLDFGWGLTSSQRKATDLDLTEPVRSWKRRPSGPFELDDEQVAATNVRVAWVGPEYPTDAADDPYAGLLDGRVLYGDMCLGFVRGVIVDEAGKVVSDMHLGHVEGVSAWQVGPSGAVYGLSYTRCTNNEGKNLSPGTLLKAVLVED